MRLFPIWKTCKARACLFALLAAASWCRAAPTPDIPSKIFFATDTAALRAGRQVSGSVVQRMVDRLVMRLTEKPTVAEAWKSLVNRKDRVGIKVAASGGPVSGTNPEIVDAIVTGLNEAGIPASQIIVWDRNLQDLIAAGYRRDGSRYQLRWVDPVKGYDIKSQVTAPVLGKLIWGDSAFGSKTGTRYVDFLGTGDQLSSRSFYSNVLSKEVTKIINVPSLADSFLTGVNGALANMVLPNLDNWRRFTRPPSYGDPYLAEIYADAMIHDKVVLTIMDGLVLQYAGGPFANPGFLLDNFTIYASRDPVALDAMAARLLDEARSPSKLPALGPMTTWLESAHSAGLGNAKEDRIEMIRVADDGLR
ncbi:MAG: DUF362 domain-containing protein [Verrucomicrobiota bacterium]